MLFRILILLILSNNLNAQSFTTTAYIDQQISCHGNNDGYISISAYLKPPTINAQFIYSLTSQDTSIYKTNGMFLNLSPNEYTVCATLNNESNCHVLNIIEPDSIIIIPNTEIPVSCHQNNGAISIEITGGTTNLQYYGITWKGSNGNIINNPTEYFSTYEDNLSNDIYNITVEDDRGCFAEINYTILKEGDINGDGNVNSIDIYAIEQLINIFGYYYKADLEKDYNIDLLDLIKLENIINDFNCY